MSNAPTSIPRKILQTYQSGGIYAVYKESSRFALRRPVTVKIVSELRRHRHKLVGEWSAIADPMQILYVNPSDITKSANKRFNKYWDVGRIVGGDWDADSRPLHTHPKFVAVRQRYEEGASWEETGIFEYLLERLEAEGRVDGCYSLADIEQRYSVIDGLYHSMKLDGYQEHKVDNILDHICASISRNGEFLFSGGGTHRLAIAQVLQLDTIPVRIVVRHRKWQQQRESIINDSERVDAHVDHPDLRHG